MAVVFDASVLIDLFNKKLAGDRRAKLDHLVTSLEKQRTKVLIPTPALAEFLVRAGAAREGYLRLVTGGSSFSVERLLIRGQPSNVPCCLMTLGHAINKEKSAAQSSSSTGRSSPSPLLEMQRLSTRTTQTFFVRRLASTSQSTRRTRYPFRPVRCRRSLSLTRQASLREVHEGPHAVR